MPVIHTYTSCPITETQREHLKSTFGDLISLIPGKSESWLMCVFNDNTPMYFGGSNDADTAYVEVNVFGSISSSPDAFKELSAKIQEALHSELGIATDRMYVRETATTNWGWNGGNF